MEAQDPILRTRPPCSHFRVSVPGVGFSVLRAPRWGRRPTAREGGLGGRQ